MTNAAYFGIKYSGSTDVWMESCGNLSSQIMAEIFETAAEAQAFLDTRRLRRGFRQSLAVAPIAVETIRELAATARHYSTLPPLPARDDRQEWADRADALESLLPLTVH
jgi:hypothetical protein